MASAPELDDAALLSLTDEGERALKEPGTTLARSELKALLLVDGMSTAAKVLKRTKSGERPKLRDTLADLMQRGYLRIAEGLPGGMIDPGDFFTLKPGKTVTPGKEAQAEADVTTSLLRRNGYCVNIARRRAEPSSARGQSLTVLIVDDDPDIGSLLRKYLKLESIETRMASSPEAFVEALRKPPLPDLVLLDVGLPGVDGFHVLERMRQHPVLKSLPVIMLTATATREAVLKGLMLGADGHITKPFKIHALVRGVKAVLGLDFDPKEHDWDLSL